MYRRTRTEMTAAAHEIHQCEEEGVKFVFLAAPVEVMLREGTGAGIAAQRMTLGEPGESGRRRPEPVEDFLCFIRADTILMAVGQDVDAGVLNEAHLRADEWGHIAIDEATMATNLPGVFAGGDCATGAATVVEAVAAGRKGAYAIHAYLGGGNRQDIAAAIARPLPKFFDIGATARQPAARAAMPVLDSQARIAAFRGSRHMGRERQRRRLCRGRAGA